MLGATTKLANLDRRGGTNLIILQDTKTKESNLLYMDHIKLWVLFVWGSWIWISIFIVWALCDVRGLTLTVQYAAELLSYNTAWHAYLFQLHKAVRCILLDSPGLSWDHSDRLGRCCQQDNGPRARGSQHYRSVNTEVIGRRQITHKLTSLSQIGSVF